MNKVLLVEDDENIAEGLKIAFEGNGILLLTESNIKAAKALMDNESLALVLLDVTLPDGNGFSFYKSYLSGKGIPVIFLTARDDEKDIVDGLDMGAEDYIVKPFSVKELIARVKRVLARNNKSSLLTIGDFLYDLDKMELKKNGQLVKLSNIELKIIHMLFQNHDKAVKRTDIIDLIWEATGNDVYDHTVTVYMKRIKDKLGTELFTTIKGVGYRIDIKGEL